MAPTNRTTQVSPTDETPNFLDVFPQFTPAASECLTTRASIGRTCPALALVLMTMLLLGAISPTAAHAESGTVMKELLTELQRTLVRVRNAGLYDRTLPKLSKATLTVKTAVQSGLSGEVSVVVVHGGTEISDESILAIKLELSPPEESDEAPVSSAGDRLADAIIEIVRAVEAAEAGIPPLHLRTLTATLRFVVETDTGGGVGFRIKPITVDFGGGVTTERIHELVVEFRR